jgi:hypothetical protein
MEERERRQRYDLNGNLILYKVGEGVFIVRGEKEPFEASFLCPAAVKSAPPASMPDRPAHSPVKPGQHRSIRRTARRLRLCTKLASEGGAVPGCMPGRPAIVPGQDWDPHQNTRSVGARCLYWTGRCSARHTRAHVG